MTKIDDTNFENKDLDWFLEDNPLNSVLYGILFNIDDSLNYEKIFNDAYRICILAYSENHPELKYKTLFGLDEAYSFPNEYLCSWYCAISMLKLNDELRQKGIGNKNLSLFISKAYQLLPARCGIDDIYSDAIENHFRCRYSNQYVSYVEKKYDFLAWVSKKEEEQQQEESVVALKEQIAKYKAKIAELRNSHTQIMSLQNQLAEKNVEPTDDVLEVGKPLVFLADGKEYKIGAKDKNIRYLLCLMAKKAFNKEKLGKEEYKMLQYILKMSDYKGIETNYNKVTNNLKTGSGNGGLLPKEKDAFEALRKKYDL